MSKIKISLLCPKTIFLFNQARGRLDRDLRTIVCRHGNGTFLYNSDQIFPQPASTLQIILGQAKSITHVRIETTSTYSKDHASIKTSAHQDKKTSLEPRAKEYHQRPLTRPHKHHRESAAESSSKLFLQCHPDKRACIVLTWQKECYIGFAAWPLLM